MYIIRLYEDVDDSTRIYNAVNTYLGLEEKSLCVDDLLHCVYRSPSIYGKYGHTALSGKNMIFLKNQP